MKFNVIYYLFFAFVFMACGSDPEKEKILERAKQNAAGASVKDEVLDLARVYFKPLRMSAEIESNMLSNEKVALGQALYYDKRLSKDGNISCNSCHNLETFGVDNLTFSPGDEGKNGDRNSPTVLNAAFHSSQFWDGRANDVEEQAGMPILNPVEMNIPSESFLIDRLSKIEEYQALFAKAYPNDANPISYKNLTQAIGAFERTLVTPAPIDAYLGGDKTALNDQQKRGLKTFVETGCITCHMGGQFGGTLMQKFGLFADYWEHTGSDPIDDGRFKVTGNESDKYIFKSSGLRNVTQTSPYFHDGSVAELDKAVIIMAKVQLNKDLTEDQVKDIVAFLGSLEGEVPAFAKKVPEFLAAK